MSELDAPPSTGAPPKPDERLLHRGPIQRLLVRPEIGALIGTTAVWFFFWATADVFGTAAGTANYLVLTYTAPIPEPAHILLICAGVVGVCGAVRQWRKPLAASQPGVRFVAGTVRLQHPREGISHPQGLPWSPTVTSSSPCSPFRPGT